MSLGKIVKKIWPGQSFHIIWVKGQGQGHSDLVLVHDTPAHQDASLYIYIYISKIKNPVQGKNIRKRKNTTWIF